jgi:hypothetical protein
MSDYLYNISVITVTYVGFSTVFVTFREALGGTMSKYDVLLIKNILYLGMVVILGCLLPPLVRLLGGGAGLSSRLPSLATAVPIVVFNIVYPKARRRATDGPMPPRVWVDMALVYAAGLLFLANAAGVLAPPSVAVHAVAVTILLVAVLLAFVFGLELLPSEPAKPIEGEGAQGQDGQRGSGRKARSASSR